ncbi:hypothetical protein CIPAW_09G217500 [Carya illinoinensis]|uniref:DNA N(6)-methyladenine demethylase n=1 Tax=Carya illinoinensis TaxID=32201 RepID=A0A8T1PNP9_CARIL|nr:hypothetical protein CIPAW_09G217500 [Carya illinoinensis]
MLLRRTSTLSWRYHRLYPPWRYGSSHVFLRFSSLGNDSNWGNSGVKCSRGKDSISSATPPYDPDTDFRWKRFGSGKKQKPAHGGRIQHGRGNSKYGGGSLNEMGHTEMEGAKQRVLRPGMVLLKQYITHKEQVEIVKKCRYLGIGPGRFYQPGYQNGAKLHLQMMCLGMNWDPMSRKYDDTRPVDGIEPPCIPREFSLLVKRAIQDAHALVKKQYHVSNVEDILPLTSPDICIVNFYTTSGRLGLHQDRDESRESLRKGLPVVSLSLGDSAEFLYGDQRNVDNAERIFLESGDVLFFGGKSRHIFHGVSSIIPKSAPKALLEETRLRPGRLNLTFRQF